MSGGKQRSEQHLIDQEGEKLLRSKLPRHWLLREYRPDYGLDFTIETFKTGNAAEGRPTTYETLGEHVFVQLKSIAAPQAKPLAVFNRGNVEKAPETLNLTDKVADIDTYRFQLETSELITVERMGIGLPVLLVIADLSTRRCSFVCLNDYIDKVLIRATTIIGSRTAALSTFPSATKSGRSPVSWCCGGTQSGQSCWPPSSGSPTSTPSCSGPRTATGGGWPISSHAEIISYDFWDDMEIWALIAYDAAALRRFIETGQPSLITTPKIPDGFDETQLTAHFKKLDVFESAAAVCRSYPKSMRTFCENGSYRRHVASTPEGTFEVLSAPQWSAIAASLVRSRNDQLPRKRAK